MVSDVGGIDDASFNENTWKGLQDAQEQLGVEATFLESQAQADYENNITEFAEQGYDMIITVGFLLGDATGKMAEQYPDIKFAIVDFAYDPPIPNVQGIVFNVDEASFPEGFLAAAMADQSDPDDPMVAYIGGMQIPPVEQFIVAYEAGVKYYNEQYGKDVKFTGVYVGDFEAPDQGKTQANSLIDEGADVIMGVGGKTGNGGLTAAKERGKLGVGVDVDQYYTLPNEKDILISSTMKRLDKAVFSVIEAAVEGNFGGGGVYVGTLENEGVGVGPFHDFEDKVPEEIKADLAQIQQDIIAGKLWTGWGEPPEGVAVTEEGAPYKVGFASAITGPASSLGLPERDCAEMLKGEVTEIVGPDGVKHPLEIIIYDTEGAGETAVTVVNKMISEDEVAVVIAGSRSPVSVALVPVTAEAEVPYISMASSSKIVEPVEEHYWAFKTPQSNDPVAYNQVEYLKSLGITKAASIYVNNAFGEDSRAGLQKWAAEAGIEIVLEESFEAEDTDMTAQLTKAKASEAEALVVHAIPPGASIITTQFRELGLDIPLIHNHGVCNKTFIELAGIENAEGTIFPCGKMLVAEELPDDDPQKQMLLDFIADYEAFSGNPRSTFAGHAWDAFQLAFSALGSLPDGLSLEEQRAAIRDYVENETAGFVGTGGVFQISPEDHNGLGPDSMTLLKVMDGEWTYFGPEAW
jgi:branched-chain amino acid transport system substrate-binding protein